MYHILSRWIINVIRLIGRMKHKLLINNILSILITCICSISAFAENRSLPDYVISSPVDLKGNTLIIPSGRRLFFKKGAQLTNGIIIGNATSIGGSLSNIFNKVQIMGSWRVPHISTAMFGDINKNNSLVNVFALTNKNVKNVVTIDPGEYWIKISEDWKYGILVVDNTEIILNGVIRLRPNDFKGYKVFNISGNNISLHGVGTIIGDSEYHLGVKGEWGMGINIEAGSEIKICDISVKNCWGDCIYIGGKATDVQIRRCLLDGSRRQGISITSAGRVCVEDCMIRNIGGTRPGYAIDVEPNNNCFVDYVLINNVRVLDCNGGFMSWHPEKNSCIGTIEILNCSVSGDIEYYDYSFERTDRIVMKNNRGVSKKIRLSKLNEVFLEKNYIDGQWISTYAVNNCKKVIRK